jgi:PPOX class probable F420-dependent enzyme
VGIQLTDEEAWDFVAEAHTGILTTLRRDGTPISLPMWFVALDRAVYCTTPSRSKKVARARRDGRASFLVESGHAWRELKAVMMTGKVDVVEDESVQARVLEEMARKYAGLGPDIEKAPEATRKHYGGGRTTLRFSPAGTISWDNARIRFRTG